MDGVEALASLGLEPGADWADIKRAYRDRIRAHHPDLSPRIGDGKRAALINEAYARLAELAQAGQLPEAPQLDPEPVIERALPRSTPPSVLFVPPGNLFDRLLEAAHEVGDVSYADPDAGTVQLLVTLGDWPASQLTCEIAARGEDPVIISTLESLDNRPAPPIETVIDLLAQRLTSR